MTPSADKDVELAGIQELRFRSLAVSYRAKRSLHLIQQSKWGENFCLHKNLQKTKKKTALFIITNTWKMPRWPLVGEWQTNYGTSRQRNITRRWKEVSGHKKTGRKRKRNVAKWKRPPWKGYITVWFQLCDTLEKATCDTQWWVLPEGEGGRDLQGNETLWMTLSLWTRDVMRLPKPLQLHKMRSELWN